jgi:hypothetical protein
MDPAPNLATVLDLAGDFRAELVQVFQRPIPVEIPQLNGTIRAIQPVARLTPLAEGMDMRRRMVIRVHSDTIPTPARENGSHLDVSHKT